MTDIKALTPEKLAEICERHEEGCGYYKGTRSYETHKDHDSLLKENQRLCDELEAGECKWCGITRQGWCKRADKAEAKLKDISTAAQPLINAWDDWLSDPMCDCEYEHVCGLNQRKAELAALQSLLKDKQ